jgi:glyoxylase-like metal-dependent hydrolase (beta-lactamase superfamily II)
MSRCVLPTAAVVVLVLAVPASFARAADEPQFEVRQIADGVYAALALPRTPINCNGAFVVYDDGVLVVDTHSRPSSARALIAQIATVTRKPVRYAVDTHFHWDHAQGAEAYLSAFPREVSIVGTEATRENLRTIGVTRVREQLERAPAETAEIRKRLEAESDPAARPKVQEALRQQEAYVAELRGLALVLPDLTFDKSMILHRKDRDIVLLFLGRGHTSGDVVTYLPQQKVVATGDLLHGWMPFMGDGYPPEWVATLDQLAKLDFAWIIGGHGDVKPRAHLTEFRNYLADLIEETRRARSRGEALDQAKASVAAALRLRHAETMGGATRFDEGVGPNVEKVFRDMEARLY